MSRPARGNSGVDGQIHSKTVLAGVRVISSHAGAGAKSIISEVIRAQRDGDSAIVSVVDGFANEGQARVLVITADRGLRARLPHGVAVAGPGWLNGLLGR